MNLEYVEVVSFLQGLGIRNVSEDGAEVHYSCPFSGHKNGDSNPSASMQQGTTITHCFSCGWSGNAVSFLSELEGVPPLKASQWIREEYGTGFKEPAESLSKEIDELLNIRDYDPIPETYKVLEETEIDKRSIDWSRHSLVDFGYHTYLIDRGFSPEILQEFDIGWDDISLRFSIPIRDGYGNLVGFKGRALPNLLPRYLVLGGSEYSFDTVNIANFIFGLDTVKIGSYLILTEGELNCISLRQKGFPNSVGISGKFLSDIQVKQLVPITNKVTLIFDETEDALRNARKLEPYMSVRIFPERGDDPADLSTEEISSFLGNSVSSLLL